MKYKAKEDLRLKFVLDFTLNRQKYNLDDSNKSNEESDSREKYYTPVRRIGDPEIKRSWKAKLNGQR